MITGQNRLGAYVFYFCMYIVHSIQNKMYLLILNIVTAYYICIKRRMTSSHMIFATDLHRRVAGPGT